MICIIYVKQNIRLILSGMFVVVLYPWWLAGRSCFSFDPDPTLRGTFWTGMIGGTSLHLAMFSSSQTIIQKAITCKTLKDGQR